MWRRVSHCSTQWKPWLGFVVIGLLVLLLTLNPTPLPAVPIRLEREITNSVGMKLVLIPEGTFVMGSPKDEKDRHQDEAQHKVEITKQFYLGVYTVTVGQFRQFVKDAGYKTEAEKDDQGGWGYNAETQASEYGKKYNWQNVGWEQTDEHPVVNVTWNDAVAFCDWLSKKEGKKYQLPTEAQWEYSCRASTKTRFYSGEGEETLKDVGNIADASFKQQYPQTVEAVAWDDGYPFTAPVGKFKPNAFGLYDMHGNVWHWCQDWYGDYPQGKLVDPLGPKEGKDRVLRGGSWHFNPCFCRSANRHKFQPGYRDGTVGFRLCFCLD